MNGLELTNRITHDFPETKVIILSMHVNEESVAELEVALEALLLGDIYLSPRQAKLVVGSYLHRIAGAAANGLTPRQLETQLMDRLGIHDVAGRVRYAIRIRLITEDGMGSG